MSYQASMKQNRGHTSIGNCRDSIIARVRCHDRQAVHTRPVERLQEVRPQFPLAT